MKSRLVFLALMLVGATGLFFRLTAAPGPAPVPVHEIDLANGENIYHIGGCISCHQAPENAKVPSGGKALKTPVGIFYPPNLTPDAETGLGNWTEAQFINAVQWGASPDGKNYIPAFPYVSYHRMNTSDVQDLFAYLKTLPPVKSEAKAPEIFGEWFVRRAMGLWNRLALKPMPKPDPSQTASWNKGRYLVMGPGHCVECHTPRNLLMMSDMSRNLEGGPHPEGKGNVPSLHKLISSGEYSDASDLAMAFSMGEMGGYDNMASGGMAEVRSNIEQLPDEDIQAISEYLVSLN